MINEAFGSMNREPVAGDGLAADSQGFVKQAEPTVPGAVASPESQEDAFANYRRRVRKEMDEHEVRVRETIMLDFLEIADNLERANAAWKDGGAQSLKAVQEGLDSVLRLFKSKLARHAVTAIESEGKAFDPRVHHAVSQSTSTETTPGIVLHEVQKGYWMDGRLLRAAAVVVSSAPAPTQPVEGDASDKGGSSSDEPASPWHGYQRNRY